MEEWALKPRPWQASLLQETNALARADVKKLRVKDDCNQSQGLARAIVTILILS